MTLKVLLINTSSLSGGAAIAANRLMSALNGSGQVEARMLVRDCNAQDPAVSVIPQGVQNRLRFLWERGVIWAANRFSRSNLFQTSIANTGYDVTATREFREADIIHIHWVQQGMLSLRDIDRILHSGKPVVWTMHDMWLCTGICHHSGDCEKFRTHCGACQYLRGGGRRDVSYRTFERKLKLFRRSAFTVVTCSRWLEGRARSGALLEGKDIRCIPNPIDTFLFSPMERKTARESLGLPSEGRLVLFASQKVTDPRKGVSYLAEAARILKRRGENFEFVIMGQNSEQIGAMMPFPCHAMGYVSSPERAALIYNACDLFVTPSLMENLPNTIMEALSCGTPCVGFEVGGIPEMIGHKENGYVAQYKSADDLAEGIRWCLGCPEPAVLRAAARAGAVADYDRKVVASQFIALYRSLIQKPERQ